MKNTILAVLSGVALFGIAACSDTDETTTQSTNPPLEDQAAPMEPAPEATPVEPAPAEPAPAQ